MNPSFERDPLVVGGRVTGPSHLKNGKGCDDAFGWISFADGSRVLAVADGAGSVSGTSAWGSWAATQFVTSEPIARVLIDELSASITKDRVDELLRLLFMGALNQVLYFGKALGLPPESLNTTLCVAVLLPNHTFVAEIGDGIVAIMKDGGAAQTVLIEDKGESATTDTYFLQLLGRKVDHPQWRWCDFGDVAAIALSTDGLRYPATSVKDNYAAHPGFFEAIWRLLETGKLSRNDLEEWLENTIPRSDPIGDDKTLLLALRPTAETTGTMTCSDASPRPAKVTVTRTDPPAHVQVGSQPSAFSTPSGTHLFETVYAPRAIQETPNLAGSQAHSVLPSVSRTLKETGWEKIRWLFANFFSDDLLHERGDTTAEQPTTDGDSIAPTTYPLRSSSSPPSQASDPTNQPGQTRIPADQIAPPSGFGEAE